MHCMPVFRDSQNTDCILVEFPYTHFFIVIVAMSGFPDKFAEELSQYLSADELQAFFSYCQRPLKKSITINTHKISVEDFIALTKERGRSLTPQPFQKNPISFYIDRTDTTLAL